MEKENIWIERVFSFTKVAKHQVYLQAKGILTLY